MKKNLLIFIILFLTLKTSFSQDKKVISTLKVKIENLQSDTLTIQLVTAKAEDKQSDWGKNIPWITAILIAILTVLTNIFISRKIALSQKEIALSQIENSRKMVQLDINKTVLSGNRQVWISTLRDSISDYIAKCHSYRIKPDQVKSKYKEASQNTGNSDLTEIFRLDTKIVLMLNSNEDDSKLLIKRLEQYTTSLFDETVITQPSEFYLQEIINVTKTILKKEWEQVKKGE